MPVDPAGLVRLDPLEPRRDGATRIVHVVEIDGFGNLITDGDLPDAPRSGRKATTSWSAARSETLRRASLVIYEDSAGDVAIAVNGGSAAELLGVRAGDELMELGMSLGEPREHYETLTSTNERARQLAETGAPHGTLVTAERADRRARSPGPRDG